MGESNWWKWGCAVVAILAFVACTCCVLGAVVLMAARPVMNIPFLEDPDGYIEIPDGDFDFPFETETPEPDLTTEPLPESSADTLKALQETQIPDRDVFELAVRYMGVSPDTATVASTTNPDYKVGERRKFSVSNVDDDEQFEIYAILVYKTDHVYMWVEEGAKVNERRLKEAADLFEEHTYPTNREFFGQELNPGVDGDPHLSILHSRNLGGTVAGYFSSSDSAVRAVRVDSNEMEMFYINIDGVTIGDEFYNGVLAHEFQHMIHWSNDLNEETWLNEGCSELAMALNARSYPEGSYEVGGSEYSYLYAPDTQLNTWPEGTAGDASANYGASYLFMEYFLDQLGEKVTQSLVAHDANGFESVDQVLKEADSPFATHQDLFADWTIANLIDNTDLDDGRYGYREIDVSDISLEETFYLGGDAEEERGSVHQYGVDYIEVQANSPVQLTFQGSTQSRLIDATAHGGEYLWWSNRADESDSRLTRVVDLRDASQAELSFWTWYHIEEDWDYAYVVVGSTDSGKLPANLDDPAIHWQILEDKGLDCTTSNPNNNSYGCGFTGKSDWVELTADLSDYAGKEIALRFEYITDSAVNQSGFAVDDIRIMVDGEEIFADDMESGSGDWIAEGFVRHNNIIPQEWIVQWVLFADDEPVEVRRLLMLDGATLDATIPLGDEADRAVLVVSAIAPVTTELAAYQYTLTPQ